MAAVVTLLEMAAENGSSANLNRGHDTALRHRKRSAMLLTIGCAVVAETRPPVRVSADPFPAAN
jgi:hypothetical protein